MSRPKVVVAGRGYVDSPAKKLIRLNVLETAMKVIGEPAFRQGRHLGLASKEAGDLSTLLGLGVKGQCIMAEINHDSWVDAVVRWPYADIRNADIMEVAALEGKFTHINFDTCAPIREEGLDNINTLMCHHLQDGCVLTAWFLVGREHKNIMEEVAQMIELLKQHLTKDVRKQLAQQYPIAVLDERLPYIARAMVLEQHVSTYVHLQIKKHVKLIRMWTYTSTDYEAGKLGSPMVVVQMLLCEKNTHDLTQQLLVAIKHDHFILVGDVKKRLGMKAIELMEEGRDPGLLLNSPKSMAAWLAHKTRGTYG